MRKTSWLCLLALLFYGCFEKNDSKSLTENLCREQYCVEDIKQFGEGFFISPIDTNVIGRDHNGHVFSLNTLLVRFKKDISLDQIKSILMASQAKVSAFIPQIEVWEIRLEVASADNLEDKLQRLLADNNVKSAEKNYAVELESLDIENPTGLSENLKTGLWGLERIKLALAYRFIEMNAITLHQTKIAILDNGFDLYHDELLGVGVETFDLADIDDDASVANDDGHGTAIAGIIFAQNNDFALSGIMPSANFFALKIYSDNADLKYSFVSTVIMGIVYAVEKEADVINMSFSISSDINLSSLRLAVKYASEHNVVLVASAGNKGADAKKHFPSAWPEVISVGSIGYDQDDILDRCDWSNFSLTEDQDVLAVAAPGQNLALIGLDNSYALGDGTSFSAPMVAGTAGLLKSILPSLTPDEILNILHESGTHLCITLPDQLNHFWRQINILEAVKKATHDMLLPNHGLGDSCQKKSDCEFDLSCLMGICTQFCFEEKDRNSDLGWTCSNCNLFCECPLGTTCESFPQNYGRIPTRICM